VKTMMPRPKLWCVFGSQEWWWPYLHFHSAIGAITLLDGPWNCTNCMDLACVVGVGTTARIAAHVGCNDNSTLDDRTRYPSHSFST
jgi:hypothetical protein